LSREKLKGKKGTTTQFFPALPSFRPILSAPPKNVGNNIPDSADSG